ncbi:hypothetical protein [Streptomyces sp. NPDC051572]|uniref:hypothetical protein n=1 Tax=Streptomyces sp. NPDC051572 TaxID=3155802 RepID=UPI00344BDCE3
MTDQNSDVSPPQPAARVIGPRAAGDQTERAEERLLRDLRTVAGRPSGRPPLLPLGGLGTYEGEFVVDLAVPMCGRDVRDARTVLKRADPWGVGVRDLTSSLNLTEGDTAGYLGRLV